MLDSPPGASGGATRQSCKPTRCPVFEPDGRGWRLRVADEQTRIRVVPLLPQPDLNSREREVLGLIAQGLTNQEVARRMYLSVNSVKTYVRGAYRKIGAERRSQAVRWWFEHNGISGG